MAPNICSFSLWTFLHCNLLTPALSTWFLNIWKDFVPLATTICNSAIDEWWSVHHWWQTVTWKVWSTLSKPVPMPLCAPQVPLGPTSGSSRAVAVRDQRLTAWEMARRDNRPRPADHWLYFLGTLPRPLDLILLFSLCVSYMNLYVLTSFEIWLTGQARTWYCGTVGPIFCYDYASTSLSYWTALYSSFSKLCVMEFKHDCCWHEPAVPITI